MAWRNGTSKRGTASPTKPIHPCASSTAKSPKPYSSHRCCMRSNHASLAARSMTDGKNSMTSGSAFIAACGSRSASVHGRRSSRSVLREVMRCASRQEAWWNTAASGSAMSGANASSAAPMSGESDPRSVTEIRTASPGARSVTETSASCTCSYATG